MLKKENILPFIQEGLLMVFVVFVCLFGGTELVHRAYLIQLFAFMISAVMFFEMFLNSGTAFYCPAATVVMIVFLLIIFFQCLPLPMDVIKLLSPKTADFYHSFLPAGSQKNMYTLSIYPFATQKKLVEMAALLSTFILAINTIKTKRQIKRFITLCIGIIVFISLYAAVRGDFTPDQILPRFGLFSNRNYYAGLTLLVSLLCIGYGLSFQQAAKKFFFIFVAGILSISIILSLSRAAIISYFFWFCVLMGWIIQQKIFVRKNFLPLVLFMAILIIFLLAVNLGPLLEKVKTTSYSMPRRISRYQDAFSIAKDFPLFGVGLGNYGYVYTQYSSRTIEAKDQYLHSDPLQLLVESGAVGILFYCLFFVFLLKDILSQLYKRHDPFIKCVLLGGLCGIFALASHSFIEVLFPIPAIAFVFWFILGLLYKAVYIHIDARSG